MYRAIGFALLLIGVLAPTFVLACNSECQLMESPPVRGTMLDESLPPCCGGGQAVITGQSPQPQPQFRNVIPLQAQTVAVLSLEPAAIQVPLTERLILNLPTRSSPILRI